MTTDWVKPLPQPDNVSAPYWSAAHDGRLLVQECPQCAHRQWYPRALCTRCGAEPGWLECAGFGTVHTYTVIRQMGMEGFREEVPYVVAMIELDEGPRMMGNVIDIDVADMHIGLPVEAVFVAAADDIGIAQWRPQSRA